MRYLFRLLLVAAALLAVWYVGHSLIALRQHIPAGPVAGAHK